MEVTRGDGRPGKSHNMGSCFTELLSVLPSSAATDVTSSSVEDFAPLVRGTLYSVLPSSVCTFAPLSSAMVQGACTYLLQQSEEIRVCAYRLLSVLVERKWGALELCCDRLLVAAVCDPLSEKNKTGKEERKDGGEGREAGSRMSEAQKSASLMSAGTMALDWLLQSAHGMLSFVYM